MQNKVYPLVITTRLAETRRFYLESLGCQAVFDLDHYLQVRFGADPDGPELAFMASESPPLGQQEPFAGAGLTFSLPVESADARHAALVEREVPIASAPSDKPWGWRSFVAVDPNGVQLDFFHELADAAPANAAG